MDKYIVAVSGGVDSVVLLDLLASKKLPTIYHLPSTSYQLIVAHFDHGIRADSSLDAVFVADLAKKYGLSFVSKRVELGPDASEEKARDERYAFLRAVAEENGAKLVTAHHSDDVVESIAINLTRGTGWRGLAVLDSGVLRPLTDMTKSEIIKYASDNKLTWREDSTNVGDTYLRNRIRRKTTNLDEDAKRQLLGLWVAQKSLKSQIDIEVKRLIGDGPVYNRYFFTHIDNDSAIELLRFIVDARLTRPQLTKTLHAIKTFLPLRTYLAGDGVKINFTSRNFKVELLK